MNVRDRIMSSSQGEAKKKSACTSAAQFATEMVQAFGLARELMTKEQAKEWRRRWAEIYARPGGSPAFLLLEPGRN